uniref:Chromosome 11 open reading frame 97 n=1 Tax=Junco hyemalis TaxID=40217 RepID=A0A8C5NTX6_JUNHY
MRAADGHTPAEAAAAAGEPGSDVRGEQPRQKCVYVEPPRRVKEILEEHFHLQEEECNVNHPTAVALEGVWNVKNNFSIKSLKPVSQNNSDLLLQPQFYSRHARMKNC